MKVGSITTKIFQNKTLKKGLEKVANNGSLFVAGTQLALAAVVRPTAILSAPKADKENKKLACAKSFASALTGFLIVDSISSPISKGIKRIDEAPQKYLSQETIQMFKEGSKPLLESKSYQFATQMFKLGTNVVTAVPKAIITCALIPPLLSVLRRDKNKNVSDSQKSSDTMTPKEKFAVLNCPKENLDKNSAISFTGAKPDSAKIIGKIIDSASFRNFSQKYKESNFQMHTMAIADTLSTVTLVQQVNSSKKIEPQRKKVLNCNNVISSALGIMSGYLIDKGLDKPFNKIIEKFSVVNANDAKLSKCIEGIKIVKPTLIYGLVYYGLIPFVSTFIADKFDLTRNKNSQKSA